MQAGLTGIGSWDVVNGGTRELADAGLVEFDFDHARGLKREIIAHLGTLDFVTAKDNVVFRGPVSGWSSGIR